MSKIMLKINGKQYSVGGEVPPETSLLMYLRDVLQLCDTKAMCRAAGCGACLVGAVVRKGGPLQAVNSCVVPILSCRGWEVTTISKLGNRRDGFHPIQLEFAKKHATQCGHCTPGWIMNLYCLLKSGKDITMREMERSFGSNICRCTGYRPILDVVKSYASDHPNKNYLPDIEDLKICNSNRESCSKATCEENEWCHISTDRDDEVKICFPDNRKWYIVKYVYDIFQVLKKENTDSYMLVHGNTAKVPYPIKKCPDVMICINDVTEMQEFTLDQNLVIGAGVPISKFIDILEAMAEKESFEYLKKVVDHAKLIAHIPVRNVGSLGGNLMIKHQHNEFPSDIYLLLDTVGAELTIISNSGSKESVSMEQFLKINMKRKIILNIKFPPLGKECRLVTYKIMPRAQGAHGTVIAGYLFKLSSANKVHQCRIAYGNISPTFTRAFATENFFIGKNLFHEETLKSALVMLGKELIVEEMPPEASARCRNQLALNLLFKCLLTLYPKSKLHPKCISGAVDIRASRPVSKACQVYDTNKSLWPLNQPVEKIEAKIQASGEALYTDDIPKVVQEAFLAFVVTTVATGTITNIDPNSALACEGVIAFFSAKDIPGTNSFIDPNTLPNSSNEEVFCDGTVKYFNQPVGIIVAETQIIADNASLLVRIKYENVKLPVIDIKDAIKDPKRLILFTTKPATEKGNDIAKVIKHKDTIYGQYHFAMETIGCVVRPTDETLKVYVTTQWPSAVQLVISKALKIDLNKIDVFVPRVGGSFGSKISRASMIAVACCLAAYILNRPCRMILSMETSTRCLGKRLSCESDWEFAVNSSGMIQHSRLKMYEDNGYKRNELFYLLALDQINNCYINKSWSYKCYDAITDTPKNTWCRSPGTTEAVAMVEHKFERTACELSLDPLDIRLLNMDPVHNELREMIDTLIINSDYENRKCNVKKFNTANRWKKRGTNITPLAWKTMGIPAIEVMISIYHGDGTVSITHGGVEIGQGINTKAAQICAYSLGIPIEKVQIKCNNTISTPNSSITGGSITSQNVCYGVKKCCDILTERFAPLKKQTQGLSWSELVSKAFEAEVSLVAHASCLRNDCPLYVVYGAVATEVEIDTLTGDWQVLRVDLIEDAGQSVSPGIDIGQIEGAFIMGQSYWTTEKLVYDKKGKLLTDSAWSIHVHQALDIPQDLRVYLRKKSYSNDAAFGAKCTGEPATCLSVSVGLAIRQAITAARCDVGIPGNQWFSIIGPYSTESIILCTETKREHLVYC